MPSAAPINSTPPPPITTESELDKVLQSAIECGWAAIDTEFLRERTFAPRLCLIQIATAAQPNGYCIDPLAIDDLTVMDELLNDENIVKIFHSCRQDLESFDTRLDVCVRNLYDTQLAAAFCGYGMQMSYAGLVDIVCDVRLPKSYTRADWSHRPLPAEHLEYALDDVKYLPELRAGFDRVLTQKGRMEWYKEECLRLAEPMNYRHCADNAWRRLTGLKDMEAAGVACARRLSAWREQKAKTRNLPRGWILPTPALVAICYALPTNKTQLAEINEVAPGIVKHSGAAILQMVEESIAQVAGTAMFKKLTPRQRGRVTKIMNMVRHRAEQLDMEKSLFVSRREVENYVRFGEQLPLFTGWRAQLVGDDIHKIFG